MHYKILIFLLIFFCNKSNARLIRNIFSNFHQKINLETELIRNLNVDTNDKQLNSTMEKIDKIKVPNNIAELLKNMKNKSSFVFPLGIITKNLKLGFYFFLWYFFTVVYNISNKQVLNELPLPATVAFLQLVIGIGVFMPVWLFKRPNFESIHLIFSPLCKISFCHALGQLFTVMCLNQGAVSFTHIVKASEPVFSAILSTFILGAYFPTNVYLTLIPIVLGVALASIKEFSFTWIGFITGMLSNFFYQLRIVLSKKEFNSENNKLSPSNFFRVLTIISAIELLPISIALEGYNVRAAWESAGASGK